MDEGTILILLLLVLTPISGYLCFLVWFDYNKLDAMWFTRAKAFYERSNAPFSSFYASFLNTNSFTCLVKVVITFMFFLMIAPLILMFASFIVSLTG